MKKTLENIAITLIVSPLTIGMSIMIGGAIQNTVLQIIYNYQNL